MTRHPRRPRRRPFLLTVRYTTPLGQMMRERISTVARTSDEAMSQAFSYITERTDHPSVGVTVRPLEDSERVTVFSELLDSFSRSRVRS